MRPAGKAQPNFDYGPQTFLYQVFFSSRLAQMMQNNLDLLAYRRWTVQRLMYHYHRLRGATQKIALRRAGYNTRNKHWRAWAFDNDPVWKEIEQAMKSDVLEEVGITDKYLVEAIKGILDDPKAKVAEKLKAWEYLNDLRRESEKNAGTVLPAPMPDGMRKAIDDNRIQGNTFESESMRIPIPGVDGELLAPKSSSPDVAD